VDAINNAVNGFTASVSEIMASLDSIKDQVQELQSRKARRSVVR